MKTIVLEEPGLLRLTDTEPPGPPAPGEALVRVRRVGICGTDLHAFRGRQPFFSYPRILGHELGVEIAVPGPTEPDLGFAVGDYCCVEPYLNCGHCSACRRGKTNCCLNLQVLGVHTDGGMREWITVPLAKLHTSQTLSLDHLALVEMLCIGAHAVRRAQLEPGEPTLVIGAGPIGLSVIQFAQLVGAHVIVMEIVESRLEFCRQQLGVEFWVNGRRDPIPQLQDILAGDLPAAVFDATGNVNSMMNAFSYVAHGGRLIFVGLVQDNITFHDPDFHRRELTLLSSRNATGEDFAWVIQRLEAGKINLTPWITHRASPEEIVTEFPRWLEPETGVIKAMVEF
jgi:2-desacetyl-2-hydroxyethyl bacteriochlorophyllide A dehydrogenase